MSAKPTVHYKALLGPLVIGRPAVLDSVTDHPNHLAMHCVSNNPDSFVRTSNVVAFDTGTGRIETMNTIYMPKE